MEEKLSAGRWKIGPETVKSGGKTQKNLVKCYRNITKPEKTLSLSGGVWYNNTRILQSAVRGERAGYAAPPRAVWRAEERKHSAGREFQGSLGSLPETVHRGIY